MIKAALFETKFTALASLLLSLNFICFVGYSSIGLYCIQVVVIDSNTEETITLTYGLFIEFKVHKWVYQPNVAVKANPVNRYINDDYHDL